MKIITSVLSIVFLFVGACTIIEDGEVGVEKRLGKINMIMY